MFRMGILLDWAGAYGRRIAQGVMRYVDANPEVRIVRHSIWAYELPRFAAGKVDGVITEHHEKETVAHLVELGVPVVSVHDSMQNLPWRGMVAPDDVAIGVMAAEHLLGRGVSQFATYMRTPAPYAINRERGFASRLLEAGFTSARIDLDKEEGLSQWLSSRERPVGILAENDDSGWLLLEACRQQRIRVPEDVTVVGVDDDDLVAVLARPKLSSVVLPLERIGFEAAQMLQAIAQKGRIPSVTRLPPVEVTARDSSNWIAESTPEVAAATRFIRTYYAKAIGVEQISEAVMVGQRTLERRFRWALGHSVHQEVLKTRLEAARSLLAQTDLSVAEIAERCGFRSASYLGVAFKPAVGVTPSAFRQQSRVHSNTLGG